MVSMMMCTPVVYSRQAHTVVKKVVTRYIYIVICAGRRCGAVLYVYVQGDDAVLYVCKYMCRATMRCHAVVVCLYMYSMFKECTSPD
jgi:hypothetical protein